MKKIFKILSVTFLVLIPSISSGTVLGDVAASMAPGEWRELSTNGLTNWADGGTADTFIAYCPRASWDPVTRRVYYLASGGHNVTGAGRLMVYHADNNTWQTITSPQMNLAPLQTTHVYESISIDPTRRKLYWRRDSSLSAMDLDTVITDPYNSWIHNWRSMSTIPGFSSSIVFPDTGEFVDVPQESSWIGWTNLSTGTTGSKATTTARTQGTTRYSPAKKEIIFGGGPLGTNPPNDGCLQKMDINHNVSKLSCGGFTYWSNVNHIEPDPVTGDVLYFGTNGILYALNTTSNTWSTVGPHPLGDCLNYTGDPSVYYRMMTVAIDTYGVIMVRCVSSGGDVGRVFLYKHSPFSADTVPPKAPANFWRK